MEEIQAAIDLIMKDPPGGGRSVHQKRLLEMSAKYCDAVRPYYRDLARRYADALVLLGNLIGEHAVFAQELRGRGVMWSGLNPLQIVLPAPHLNYGSQYRAVEWAANCGHVPEDIIPADWKRPSAAQRLAADRQHFENFNPV